MTAPEDTTAEPEGTDDTDAEQPPADTPALDHAGTDDDGDPRIGRARRDAAGYRDRLRTTEAERDRLAAELAEHRRDHITRLAAEAGMAAPEDLLAVVDETTLYDPETGRVDPQRVNTAARDALAARPHWRRPTTLPGRPTERLRGGGDPDHAPSAPSWADVVRPGR